METPSISIEILDDIDTELYKRIRHLTNDLPDGATVKLIISSYGGMILTTISIIETLKRFNTKADICGFACSAAAILAISCDECSMSENASMLIHSAWSESGNSNDPGIQRCNELQLNIIHNRCPEFNPEAIKKDTWLSAEDCLNLHLIDNIYITDAIDYQATCKRYAAKLSNILYNKEVKMPEEKLNEVVREVKEEAVDELAENPTVSEDKPVENHDLVEVVEKLTEELNALKARVLALEEPADKPEDKPEAVCEDKPEEDPAQARINNIYNNIMKPQARVAIGTPKEVSKPVYKVDYKAFASYLKD